MATVSVGGHRYSDPDVLSLIRSGNVLLDPRREVTRIARELNESLRSFDGVENPRRRLEILASMAGINVSPMNTTPSVAQNREALLYQDSNGNRHAFYDPTSSDGRINFSIAHEIVHTFFPNSLTGARFRGVHTEQSREATELERLCDLGASELLMPQEEFLEELGGNFGLKNAPRLAERFGSSFEATVFRLATAYQGVAIAGRLHYRYRKSEERQVQTATQLRLFARSDAPIDLPTPKYRRQSLHSSLACIPLHLIPWNKSFDESSCVYKVSQAKDILRARERLPNRASDFGWIECIRAPYQQGHIDDDYPDVLFLWWK